MSNALDIARQEEDLTLIRQELSECGYVKKHAQPRSNRGRVKIKSKPFHYISSDGFHMYVGRNNYQNDELTFHFANGGDWRFHAKGTAGSHVIVKTEGRELPDSTFEEAGRLDLPGRPVSFRTTDVFLRTFGIASLAELPPLHGDDYAERDEAAGEAA